MRVGRYGNAVMVPSNQLNTPAGQNVEFAQRPVDLALSPSGTSFAVLLPSSVRIYSAGGQFQRSIPLSAASLMGLAFSPDGGSLAVSQLNQGGGILLVDPAGIAAARWIQAPPDSVPAGLAFDGSGATLYVALNRQNMVARIDTRSGAIVSLVDVGVAPLGLALTPGGDRLFVTNWGGPRPSPTERSAYSSGTLVAVDERGIASSGSVSVIDTATFQAIAEIPAGLHPSGIRIAPDKALAAVANANSDTVTLLDTRSLGVTGVIRIPAFPAGYFGSSPTAVAFSPTGQWLYVACGGINAVAVLERGRVPSWREPQRAPRPVDPAYALRGFVPAGWYPVALAAAATPDGRELVYVANSKGAGSGGAISQFRGTVTIFPGPAALEAAPSGSAAVASGNDPFAAAPAPSGSPIRLRSLGIQHVFLIIKENRTYDQVLGDLPQGNGIAKYTLYGSNITPNQHALATQFVTLDNFYASGSVSADGHQWLTQAMATDYLERAHAGYPRGSAYRGDDPLVFAPTGFLWNNAQAKGLSVRVFGEFTVSRGVYPGDWSSYLQDAAASPMRYTLRSISPVAALNPYIEASYPAFTLDVPDTFRARVFLDRFADAVAQRNLPNLVLLQLPADHTQGLAPGAPAPSAMLADNDLAVGRIVDAIAKSPYWPASAVFITEDDAQDGVDHVDGHRTLCLVASPYARRGVVDSTQYNSTSVLRTIEELLGLPPMNKFDAAALPMRSVFTTTADFGGYEALPNQVPLDQMNPPLAALRGPARDAARSSAAMNFRDPDAAPAERLNRILWQLAKGWGTPYPKPRHGPSCPRGD
jgi:YVTN family beta-propeller protein